MRPASGSVGAVSNGRSSGTREQIGIEVQVLGVGAVLGDRLKHHGSESITELPGLYSFAEAVHRAGDIPAVDTEHHGEPCVRFRDVAACTSRDVYGIHTRSGDRDLYLARSRRGERQLRGSKAIGGPKTPITRSRVVRASTPVG